MADRRKPQEILDHITSSHATLESLIYSLDEHQQTKPGAIGKWTVKEVMAHIGHWEEIGYEVLYDFVHNGKKPTEDYTQFLEYNDKWEPELQAHALEESIHLFESGHARLFGFLSSLKDDQWSGYVRAWVPGLTYDHFDEHIKELRALQGQQ